MAEYIDREEFLKRIKPYDTSDKTDKALYNFALNKMIETPTADAIPIPEGATNGDVIKAMFPNAKNIRVDGGYPLNYIIEGEWHRNLKEWWDAPYRKVEE